MLRALSTAATGMEAEQRRLDITAHNIANVATNGFKKSRGEFEDMMYQVARAPGSPTSQTTISPTGVEIGMGVRTAATSRTHAQGELRQTDNPLDLAIEGNGFFSVMMPNGQTAYTRDGAFQTDPEGRLVTRQGYPLAGNIQFPPDADTVIVARDGTVSTTTPTNPEPVIVGQLEIATFVNVNGLESAGHNLFLETAGSGAAIKGAGGENGTGLVTQGAVELSNVKVVEEMIDLIAGQRAYEINSRVIRAADEMLQQTSNLR
ncbi:flagellar basal-body rod protein FlgG [Myxococcota bacterium]|nr:flagellar basal-body rod protein FlgG [Myxococcota bacterium]